MSQTPDSSLDRMTKFMLVVGIAALAYGIVLGWSATRIFYQAYLFSWLFWFGLSLGAMAIVMVHHLTGGIWGFLLRRPLEAAFRILPLMVALFIPLIINLDKLYVWARPEAIHHPGLEKKIWYLNETFFFWRVAMYFLLLVVLSYFLVRWSDAQDVKSSPGLESRLRRLSAAGLILYTLIVLFSSTDLVMSLAPQWYSTTFALLFGVSQMLSAMAFGTAMVAGIVGRIAQFDRLANKDRFNDLGNLLLMFVLTWTYLAFTQYLIIWYGNLPPEISWYIPRVQTSWQWLALFLVLFHFAIPFAVLLLRKIKRSVSMLGALAATLVLIHGVEVFWMVMPVLRKQGFEVQWIDLLVFIGISGLWSATFVFLLKGRPLLPLHAQELKEAMEDAGS